VSTTKIAHATIAIERISIVADVKEAALIFIDPATMRRAGGERRKTIASGEVAWKGLRIAAFP
jgi:hypothetical protein